MAVAGRNKQSGNPALGEAGKLKVKILPLNFCLSRGVYTKKDRKMNRLSYSVTELLERGAMEQPPALRQLFHRLNNQLGIILAHAELMEKKAADETTRSRAGQVVSTALDAMGTAKELRLQMDSSAETKK